MKFLLLLSTLAALDTIGVIAGPVGHDTDIVPRAAGDLMVAPRAEAGGITIDLGDLGDLASNDDSDMVKSDVSVPWHAMVGREELCFKSE